MSSTEPSPSPLADAGAGAVQGMVQTTPVARPARLAALEPFRVMDVLQRARELEAAGRDIIHLEVGEPDFPTPAAIVAAGQAALADGATGYTPALGIPQLRAAIAADYRDRYRVPVEPERIAVTPGASGALQLALLLSLDPGDGVLVPDPGYPCYRQLLGLLDARPVPVVLPPERGGIPLPEDLAACCAGAGDTPVRALLWASPANPTGVVLPPAALEALAGFCAQRGMALILDEIYQGLIYDDLTLSTGLALPGEVLVVNSFSKYFGMTGWRLGWLVAPRARMRQVEMLAQNLYINAPTPAQHAALAAFGPATLAEAERRRQAFGTRRDRLLQGLEALGFAFPARPRGAFYLYGRVDHLGLPATALARHWLEAGGVAVTPGTDFGRFEAESHVRFAYTRDLSALEEAVARLAALV